jgi:hypothetical protein
LPLGFVLACGSGSAEQNDPPSRNDVEPRAERPAVTEPEPSAEDDAMPVNPAATDPEDAPDESPAAPGASAGNSSSLPPAAAFASCTRRDGSYGTNCDYLYVTMTQAPPGRCVQLSIDNCGDGYGSPGLPVDTPLSWKLSSAAIGSSPEECELGVFNPEGTIVVDASGSIDWEAVLSTALPTGIVLDLTLEPSSSADDTANQRDQPACENRGIQAMLRRHARGDRQRHRKRHGDHADNQARHHVSAQVASRVTFRQGFAHRSSRSKGRHRHAAEQRLCSLNHEK